jgi:hypothetical protein
MPTISASLKLMKSKSKLMEQDVSGIDVLPVAVTYLNLILIDFLIFLFNYRNTLITYIYFLKFLFATHKKLLIIIRLCIRCSFHSNF